MSIERACCTCQWWDQKSFSKDKRNAGLCRVNPPEKNGCDDDYYGWPMTYDEDWCGRWQQREDKWSGKPSPIEGQEHPPDREAK